MASLPYGSGDAVTGLNSATDGVLQVSMMGGVIQRYNIPAQTCVLTLGTNTLKAISRSAGGSGLPVHRGHAGDEPQFLH